MSSIKERGKKSKWLTPLQNYKHIFFRSIDLFYPKTLIPTITKHRDTHVGTRTHRDTPEKKKEKYGEKIPPSYLL